MGHVACVGGVINDCNRLVGKPERNSPCIKICLKETGRYGVDWINLALDKDQWQTVVEMVTNIRIADSRYSLNMLVVTDF